MFQIDKLLSRDMSIEEEAPARMAVLPRRDPPEVMTPVSDPSVPQEAARAAFLKEALSLRIEEELARLYTARPELSDRIDRASSLVVRQLASPPRLRCIRVRVGRAGARFLVDSSTTPGATYVVDPNRWRCSCPDHHRRNAACKHSLAAWLLWKVSLSQDLTECAACGRRSRKRDMVLLHADNHSGLNYFDGDRLCAGCADAVGVSR
jgi:SWIM zinc finger